MSLCERMLEKEVPDLPGGLEDAAGRRYPLRYYSSTTVLYQKSFLVEWRIERRISKPFIVGNWTDV